MAVFKCKICGGDLSIGNENGVAICDSCGVRQTSPSVNDDIIVNLYNRANHHRLNHEFDKAIAVYESILNMDATQAEAYWAILLCEYGIEYVKDAKTHVYHITSNRTSYTSIYANENYKGALKYASNYQKSIYEKDAAEIADIQKRVLEISNREKSYDIFICYKEKDQNGDRTYDSVLAESIYIELINAGYSVFFSRISLEDKIGMQFEPYIFAALNSAKVMIVVGTKKEYLESSWVRNEWSRFLSIAKTSTNKTLIPVYRDMSPYDFPVEFSHIQALDISKLGFMQDLVRGIRKIVEIDQPKEQFSYSEDIRALERRMFIFLEDKEFQEARQYSRRILDIDPENAKAYTGAFMCDFNLTTEEQISMLDNREYFNDNDFVRAVHFADVKYRKVLLDYKETAFKTMWLAESKISYDKARMLMVFCDQGVDKDGYKKALEIFLTIEDYEDTREQIKICEDYLEEPRYFIAKRMLDGAEKKDDALAAYKIFEEIKDFSDSEVLLLKCIDKYQELEYLEIENICDNIVSAKDYEKLIYTYKKMPTFNNDNEGKHRQRVDLKIKEVADRLSLESDKRSIDMAVLLYELILYTNSMNVISNLKIKSKRIFLSRLKKVLIISAAIMSVLIVLITMGNQKALERKEKIYIEACELYNKKDYELAIAKFETISNYKDTEEKKAAALEIFNEDTYQKAVTLMNSGQPGQAVMEFNKILDYKKSSTLKNLTLGRLMDAVPKNVISIGVVSAALTNDGKILYIDSDNKSKVNIPSLTNVVGTKYNESTIFIKSDGSVVSTLYYISGVAEWTDIVDAAIDYKSALGVKSDGTIIMDGDFSLTYNIRKDTSTWTNIVSIFGDSFRAIGLKKNGRVVTTGQNIDGELNTWDWTDIVKIDRGSFFTVGLKKDGTVVATGRNDYGQTEVSSWTDIIDISATGEHCVGLRADGTVVAVGNNYSGATQVSKWTDIVAVFTYYNFTVGLKSDGTVVYTGKDEYGRYGIAEWSNIRTTNIAN